jgi:hypothetical protein
MPRLRLFPSVMRKGWNSAPDSAAAARKQGAGHTKREKARKIKPETGPMRKHDGDPKALAFRILSVG